MKTIILAATLATLAFSVSAPAFAGLTAGSAFAVDAFANGDYDKRSKPRVPGGSGCDDPRDLIEHPECRP